MENIIDVKADEFGERNVRMLAELDLKIVVSYLLLCDKDLTQAKLARELGITPVALSRLLNAEDAKVGNDMSVKLIEVIDKRDTMGLYDSMRQTLRYFFERDRIKKNILAIKTIEKYIHKYYGPYHLSEKTHFYLHEGHLLFECQDMKWVFYIKSIWRDSIGTGNVRIKTYPREIEYQKADKFTYICTSWTMRTIAEKGRCLDHPLSLWKESYNTVSAIELTPDLKCVISDRIMYDKTKGIDFPDIESDTHY